MKLNLDQIYIHLFFNSENVNSNDFLSFFCNLQTYFDEKKDLFTIIGGYHNCFTLILKTNNSVEKIIDGLEKVLVLFKKEYTNKAIADKRSRLSVIVKDNYVDECSRINFIKEIIEKIKYECRADISTRFFIPKDLYYFLLEEGYKDWLDSYDFSYFKLLSEDYFKVDLSIFKGWRF